MATIKTKQNSSRGPNYHQIESGKLADAIYRNNTTFRKQLEAEIQKLEIDTAKAQRNLEQNQIAFRNKIRLRQQQWLKKQEKQQDKMYHYVYTMQDSPTDNMSKNVTNNKSQSRISTIFTPEFDDEYDNHVNDYDDDDNFSLDGLNDNDKKPILILMNNKSGKSSQSNKQKTNNIDRFGDFVKIPNHNNVIKSPRLFNEKTSVVELSTPIQDFNSKRSGTTLLINNTKSNKVPSNVNQIQSHSNNNSSLSRRSIENNNSDLLKSKYNNMSQVKSSSFLSNANPIEVQKINLNKQEKPYQSNSSNSLITAKLTQLNDNKSNLFKINGTQSTMSFLPGNKNVDVRQNISRSQTKFFHNYETNIVDDDDNNKRNTNFTSATSSFNKLPSYIKEYRININRNKQSNKNIDIIEHKDPFVKSFELIDTKSFKQSSISNNNKHQQQQQQSLLQKQDYSFKLPSAAINKQKFENRIKSTLLKSNYDFQKNQQEQERLEEQQRTLKIQILNDERFLNLVSTLGTVL